MCLFIWLTLLINLLVFLHCLIVNPVFSICLFNLICLSIKPIIKIISFELCTRLRKHSSVSRTSNLTSADFAKKREASWNEDLTMIKGFKVAIDANLLL